MTPSIRRLLLLSAFALTSLLLWGDVLWRRDWVAGAPGFNDITRQFAFFHSYYQRALAGGEWPLWNPYVCAGMPAAMFGQNGLFYPPNWLTLTLNSYDAIDTQLAFHFFLALTLTYWIARRLGLCRAGAATAAAAWTFSGAMIGRLFDGHLTIVQALAWYPVAWGGVYRLAGRPPDAAPDQARDWAAAVAGFAAMGLAGAPQIWMFALIVTALSVFARRLLESSHAATASSPNTQMRAWARGTRLGRPLMATALAISLAGAEWIPVAAAGGHSARAQLAPEYPESDLDYPFEQTLALAFPHFFGDKITGYWGRGFFSETAVSAGAGALALACLFSLGGAHRLLGRVNALIGVAALILAWGWQLKVYAILKLALPPMQLVTGATRFLFAVSWALSLGAALGVDALERHFRGESECAGGAFRRLLALTLAFGFFAVFLWVAKPARWSAPASILSVGRSTLFVGALAACAYLLRRRPRWSVAAGWLAAGVVWLEALTLNSRYFQGGPSLPAGEIPEGIRAILKADREGGRVLNVVNEFVNYSMRDGFEEVNGYTVTMPSDFIRVACWMTEAEPRARHRAVFNRPTEPFCYWLSIRHILAKSAGLPVSSRWREVYKDTEYALLEMTERYPRARIYRDAVPATPAQMESAMWPRLRFRPEDVLLIEGPVAPPDGPSKSDSTDPRLATAPLPEAADIRLREMTLNRRQWQVMMPVSGWFLMHETFLPGWRARIDGQPVRLHRAQYSLCAVPLAAGIHRVELLYRPASVFVGLATSGLGIVALLGIWLIPAFQARRKRRAL